MSGKQTQTKEILTLDNIEMISSIAAKEAVKETVAYLASEAFKAINADNNKRIERAIKETLDAHEKKRIELERKQKKNMVKNTELLITHFRKCKEMVREIDLDRLEDEGTFLSSEELTLETLERYRYKTYKMVRHIENMLVAYDNDTKRGTQEERRRFLIMQRRYIADNRMSIKEIMEHMNVSQSTVYSDSKKAMQDMSSFIFGYESVTFK
ncbi:helix-turn-helix domain-containing protein [Jeotgalibaca porci]|uniref:helix-turn-helix domain-containing protein n=1 Tax=Jeotgalibaca porci TaxID=1868793 RepID=UPI0035A1A5A5